MVFYFLDSKVPQSITKLLENVRIIFITINPIDRAYSCYQVRYKAMLERILKLDLFFLLFFKALEVSH